MDVVKELRDTGWKKSKASIFWGEIAPCDHVVQIYESDDVFLNALSGFVGDGINSGDSVIVIATNEHIEALNRSLKDWGINIASLIADDRFLLVDARVTLDKFMIKGWPDEDLFNETVSGLIEKATSRNRKVRAFGEMVALLWADGNNGATVQLEHLWNKFCEKKSFALFCAYPRTGFTQDMKDSLSDICCAHSRLISGTESQVTDIYYQDLARKAV